MFGIVVAEKCHLILSYYQYLLGYISDFDFYPPHCNLMVWVLWIPRFASGCHPIIPCGSIAHFRVDDWLLYAIESPSASGGRGFVRGKNVYYGGQLVASSVQEGALSAKNE